jgi:hypothetical protein
MEKTNKEWLRATKSLISVGVMALFENGEPILTVFSKIGEDVHTLPLFQLSE